MGGGGIRSRCNGLSVTALQQTRLKKKEKKSDGERILEPKKPVNHEKECPIVLQF